MLFKHVAIKLAFALSISALILAPLNLLQKPPICIPPMKRLLDGLANTVTGSPVGRGHEEKIRFAEEFASMQELLCYDLAEKHRLDLVWGLKHPVE